MNPKNKIKTNIIVIFIDDGLLATVDQVYAKVFDDALITPRMKEAGKYFNEGNADEKITL